MTQLVKMPEETAPTTSSGAERLFLHHAAEPLNARGFYLVTRPAVRRTGTFVSSKPLGSFSALGNITLVTGLCRADERNQADVEQPPTNLLSEAELLELREALELSGIHFAGKSENFVGTSESAARFLGQAVDKDRPGRFSAWCTGLLQMLNSLIHFYMKRSSQLMFPILSAVMLFLGIQSITSLSDQPAAALNVVAALTLLVVIPSALLAIHHLRRSKAG